MIVILEPAATKEQVERVREFIESLGFEVHCSQGEHHTVLGAIGTTTENFDLRDIQLMDGVQAVHRVTRPYRLLDRRCHAEGTVVSVGSVPIGGDSLVVMAGPCAIEDESQMMRSAALVRAAGAHILRGGAFKPRTSPYCFQGLGEEGLMLLRRAADSQGLPCVSEVVDSSDVPLVAKWVDMLQVGARNMQNFRLLSALGETDKPVLLKRGAAATLEELLLAAEYILAAGNPRVVLCERGVRTFEPWTRNTMDLSAIPVLRKLTHLPIIADPSHATGIRDSVTPMALAAVAAGADGVMVEVHPDPEAALCDGAQSLYPSQLKGLMADLRIISPAVRRRLSSGPRHLHRRFEEPLFSSVVIVGVGLIGGSIALAMRELGAAGKTIGIERSDRLDEVRAAAVVDQLSDESLLETTVAEADLVLLATPVEQMPQVLSRIAEHLKAGALVTDVGSTKLEVCRAAACLPANVTFVGGHPMAGSERRSAAYANPLLFQDAGWILCPPDNHDSPLLERLKTLIQTMGAHPLLIDPDRHDRLAAAVSHVPRLIAAALANTVGRLEQADPLAGRMAAGGFRSVTRTASSPFEIWRGILASNRDHVRHQLDAFKLALEQIEHALENEESLASQLDEAARYRLAMRDDLGGLHHTEADLIVRVEDKPGALASITTALAREEINIRDIQILKIRQDEDGVLRLAFDSPEQARLGAETLRRAGHQVRVYGL